MMEFVEPLTTFLSSSSVGREFYYRKPVTIGQEKGELIGISSDGTITFNVDGEDRDIHIKAIKDIELIDEDSTYSEVDDNDKISTVKQPGISIKDKISDIVKYKVVQHLIYILSKNNHSSNIEPLKIEHRKEYLSTYTDIGKKTEIGKNILNMKEIELTDDLTTGLNEWMNQYQPSNQRLFTNNDLLSILNAFRVLWINYIKENNDKIAVDKDDEDIDVKMDKKTEEKTYSSYVEWDNWTINGTASKDKKPIDPKATDIYLRYLWPHCFQGPYYKLLNCAANREWRCKKCNKSPAGKVMEWYKENGIVQTKCNECGNFCDKNCTLKHDDAVTKCGVARSNGTCKKCEHDINEHELCGWKQRESIKDNNVTEKGRIKYYKTKRTVFTFEACYSCIEAAKNKEKKKEKEKVKKLKEKRKERRKNDGKKQEKRSKPAFLLNGKPPTMEFKDIVIDVSNYKPNPKSKSKVNIERPIYSERVILTTEMKTATSVRSALCFIPPNNLWPSIQEIRKIHDPAYIRWMPHLNIFFPFINEKYFDKIAKYIEQDIIKKNNIKSFNINLNKFDVFDRIRNELSSSQSQKVETMFLNPSGCTSEMEQIFNYLRNDWPICANKHGGHFNPHLTVGKFKIKEMLQYQRKFQNNWKNISFKCDAIYLISRRGNDPFVIRHKIPLC